MFKLALRRKTVEGSGDGRWNYKFFMALPLFVWMISLLLMPVAYLVAFSFLQRGAYGEIIYEFTLDNYVRLFDGLYLAVYARSLVMASSVTAVCFLIALPLAYAMRRARPAKQRLMFALLMIPFLSNFVVRAYAIKALLSADGPLNWVAVSLGILAVPVSFTDSSLAVWFGMITNYLPFMALPLYASLGRFDFSLLEAAQDLGANDLRAIRQVLLPLIRGGIVAGGMLVFVPTLGEFMIPDVLGGARSALLGNVITEQFLKVRDWPFGAALVTLLVCLMMSGVFLQRLFEGGESFRERKTHA